MIRRHPSTELLRRWLLADASSELPQVSDHVDRCDRCATKLEHLDADADADRPETSRIGAALLDLLAPREGLSSQVEGKVVNRLGSRQMVTVIGDLFGAGLETSKLLLTEEDL